MKNIYRLLDSGDGQKLEQFGPYTIVRPCMQAIWKPEDIEKWKSADLIFSRDEKNHWINKNKVKDFWVVDFEDIKLKISPTDFGHLGVFPEHEILCKWMQNKIRGKSNLNLLNLFAYSGMATLYLAKENAKVCHVDASKPIISWANENAKLNNLEKKPIRWIVDDVITFLKREIKRNVFYDGIILDPPSFGRGVKGQVFKIERDISLLLELCKQLLSKNALFLIFSCHTPGYTPLVLEQFMKQLMKDKKGSVSASDMFLESQSFAIPSGSYARWEND